MPFITAGTMAPTTKETDSWGTPQALFDALDEEFHFKADVAANDLNHKCPLYFTRETDGLKQDWVSLGTVFMNPPYGREIGSFIKKAAETGRRGGVVVAVIPCRTDAKWWGYVMQATEIRLIQGRLHYSDNPTSAPFPSCIVVWGTPTVPRISWVSQPANNGH